MNKQEILNRINELESEINNFDVFKYFTPDHYQEYLNGSLESVVIGGVEFYQGDILRNLDPIAFDCSYDGYVCCAYDYTQLDEYQSLWDELIELKGQYDENYNV